MPRRKRKRQNNKQKLPIQNQNRNHPASTETGPEGQSITVYQESVSGPFPPAEVVEKYNNINPDYGDRIIKWTENEQGHRHALVADVFENEHRYRMLGMRSAFLIVAIMIMGSIYLVSIDKTLYGSALFFISISGMLIEFLKGKGKRNN